MLKHYITTFSLFLVIGINQSSFAQNKEDVFIGHTIPDDPNVMFYIQKNIQKTPFG